MAHPDPSAPDLAAPASLPPGLRVYAVGDIHGRDDLLELLLAKIDADDTARGPSETTLIFLGDLVDRGPESASVVKRLRILSQQRPRVRILMGNHEEIFLAAHARDRKALRLFSRIGGRETMLSYGITIQQYERLDYAEMADVLEELIPSDDIAFLTALEDLIEIGDYLFVHAGIRPTVDIADQKPSDLRWIRDQFLSYTGFLGKMFIHGHTISEDIDEQLYRIGIDTGAYETGNLTAIGLEATDRWYLATN